MALKCFQGVAKLLDVKNEHGNPSMLEDEVVSSAGTEKTLCASRSRTHNDIEHMSTVDTLPELDCNEQNSLKDWSLTVLERFKLFQDASPVQPWAPERFETIKKLQEAPRNKGAVHLMRDIERGGCFVAVKRMPRHWTCSGPAEFSQRHSSALENPWSDAGLTGFLHSIGYAYVCDPIGVFTDSSHTYMVSAYATKGDMFSWIEDGEKPGAEREKMVRPVAEQVFEALRCLHAHGISHRDISLENILLTHEEGRDDGAPQVKLIDFGAASLTRRCSGMCGKPSYAAPEIFENAEYDGYLADTFSLGVVLFSLAARGYPWLSTRPGNCKMFTYASKNGLRAYLRARKIGGQKGTPLVECLSEPLVALLEGLLAMNPDDRFALGAVTSSLSVWGTVTGTTTSVWDSEWWKGSA